MTLAQVAQKDFEDAIRSKMVWGIIGVFVGFVGFIVIISVGTSDSPATSGDAALGLTAVLSQFFVPIVALIVGYMSVVGERQSGSMRVLLSYPHSRRDIVFGKLVGRAGVITMALGIGSALSILLVGVLIELPDSGSFVGLMASTTLFGVGFTGLAVGISASVCTRAKAMAAAIGSMLIFLIVWDAGAVGLYFSATGSVPGLEVEAWYFLVKRLNPVNAYSAVAEQFLNEPVQQFFRLGLEGVPADATERQLALVNRVPGDLPFYLSTWFAGVTLVAWAVVPTIIGYARFLRADI